MFSVVLASKNRCLQTLPLCVPRSVPYAWRRHVPEVPQPEGGRQGAPLLEHRGDASWRVRPAFRAACALSGGDQRCAARVVGAADRRFRRGERSDAPDVAVPGGSSRCRSGQRAGRCRAGGDARGLSRRLQGDAGQHGGLRDAARLPGQGGGAAWQGPPRVADGPGHPDGGDAGGTPRRCPASRATSWSRSSRTACM